MGISVYPVPSSSATKTFKEKVFTSSGTWTYPSSSTFDGLVTVTCVGGGGSGGSIWSPSSFSSNNLTVTGGGAGGEVVFEKTISVYNAGNQTVTIGEGGIGGTSHPSMPGLDSFFGNYSPANAYEDPLLRNAPVYWEFAGAGSTNSLEVNNANYTNVNAGSLHYGPSANGITPYHSSGAMMRLIGGGTADGRAYIHTPFRINASTQYTFGFYHARYDNNSGASTYTAVVEYYNKFGAYISEGTIGNFTAQTSGTSWTKVSANLTTPANTAYGRFRWSATNTTSGNAYVSGMFVALTTTGITESFTGNSTGYKWVSTVGASATVTENTSLIYALGGSGGIGSWNPANSTFRITGFKLGYGFGGAAYYGGATSTSNLQSGGAGSGAGGPAEEPFAFSSNSATTFPDISNISNELTANRYFEEFFWKSHRGGNKGSEAYNISSGEVNGQKQIIPWAANGPDFKGYGAGGFGGWNNGGSSTTRPIYKISGNVPVPFENTSGSSAPSTRTTNNSYWLDGKPNTGNGGHGIYSNSGSTGVAGYGGSGIVIVRWYE